MAVFEVFPRFYDSVGQVLSSEELNLIRANVGIVDAASYRTLPAFDSSTGIETNTPGYVVSDDPLRIWWGAFRFRTGMTSLTVEGLGRKTSAEGLRVYINGSDTPCTGTLLGTITLPTTGSPSAFSQSYAISGFSDGDVVPVELVIAGGHSGTAKYVIYDVYGSPVTKSGYPGVPSFSYTYDAAKLNQLCNACQWIYDRINGVPLLPRLGMFYNLGPFKPPTDPQHVNRPLYYGSVGKYYSNAVLSIKGNVTSATTTGFNFVVQLNGTTAYTSGTLGIGTTNINVSLPLTSYTLGSRIEVAILASTVTAGVDAPWRFTRWSIGQLWAGPPSGGWGYATLPSAFNGPEAGATSASSLTTALNALCTILTNTKARIDARPELWSRGRALRRHYTRNGATEADYKARATPRFVRTGSVLFVKGKGTTLGYGSRAVPVDKDYNGWEKYTYTQTQNLTDSDKLTAKNIYLDSVPGLYNGSAYALLNDPLYAEETLS